jgi:prolyl-tRNA editing enzyme YbaK/EbsC (Cys-tRNA(Pro) deacylase)
MSSELRKSARQVQDFLQNKGFSFEVKELSSSTRTAKEAAESIGCTVSQIAKSLIFRDKATDTPVLVIASGTNRVDVKKIKAATGINLGSADADFVRHHTGFAIGGIPPVGHTSPLKTFIDEDLLSYDRIWAAAGTPFAVFPLTPADLDPLTGGTWLAVTG